MADIDKIAERIKKLLAIANNAGATEEERDTALKMAQHIMTKYNLDESDLPQEKQEPRTIEEMMMSGDTWVRDVGASVSRLFFCKYFFKRTGTAGRDNHKFVGKTSNVVTSLYMFEYLVKNLKKEASKNYGSVTSPEGRSFCVGAAAAIRSRVTKMLAEEKSEAAPGRELVLKSLYQRELDANMAFLESMGMHLKNSNRSTRVDPDAFNGGMSHGSTIALNRQVGGSATRGVKRIGG